MIKKLLIPLAATALFIILVGTFVQKNSILPPTKTNQPEETVPVVTIGDKTINTNVLKTTEEKEKGLSGVKTLDTDSGMLFDYSEGDKSPGFWMKGMEIPIDIIWIKEEKIIKIDKNIPIPEPNTADNKLKIYSAGQKIDYVLEVNAGFSDSNSIKVGDTITVSGI